MTSALCHEERSHDRCGPVSLGAAAAGVEAWWPRSGEILPWILNSVLGADGGRCIVQFLAKRAGAGEAKDIRDAVRLRP